MEVASGRTVEPVAMAHFLPSANTFNGNLHPLPTSHMQENGRIAKLVLPAGHIMESFKLKAACISLCLIVIQSSNKKRSQFATGSRPRRNIRDCVLGESLRVLWCDVRVVD